MATLSFTVKPKKQKLKLSFNKRKITNALFAFLLVSISTVSCALIATNNLNFINQINKPVFFVNPVVYAIISIVVCLFSIPSLYISYNYENNYKTVKGLTLFSFLLNIICFLFFFVVNSIAMAVLAAVSNTVVCCYYFKNLKHRALGTYLFIPYMIWIMFNVVLVYCIYLLN